MVGKFLLKSIKWLFSPTHNNLRWFQKTSLKFSFQQWFRIENWLDLFYGVIIIYVKMFYFLQNVSISVKKSDFGNQNEKTIVEDFLRDNSMGIHVSSRLIKCDNIF